ncbi:hypothetical protein VNI00_005515 [Paramarasmius palmivorus]|uniref:Uncharacterized protein n=1 Tax=Paramarasmius palmivorus TaxID=297713 RepID=A0AAW0DEH1_9AGAR
MTEALSGDSEYIVKVLADLLPPGQSNTRELPNLSTLSSVPQYEPPTSPPLVLRLWLHYGHKHQAKQAKSGIRNVQTEKEAPSDGNNAGEQEFSQHQTIIREFVEIHRPPGGRDGVVEGAKAADATPGNATNAAATATTAANKATRKMVQGKTKKLPKTLGNAGVSSETPLSVSV